MKKKTNNLITVLVDTREKLPFDFSSNENVENVIYQKLDTADYSIKGAEDILAIERKRSTAEIAQNLLDERFYRELKRLEQFKHAFILCEFSMTDIINFPVNSKIPPSQWNKLKITGEFLLKQFISMCCTYNIHILLCDNKINAYKTCIRIFKNVNEELK